MSTTGGTTNAKPQRTNRFSFLVTWPESHPNRPAGLPASYRVHYPTLTALDDAAEGFRLLGAGVTAYHGGPLDGGPNPYTV